MKISILTACYNKDQFIKACVKSVANQTYSNWEHIIVDDCSTDHSYDYLSRIKDKRVKVIRNDKRKFCSSCYAIALEHATGDICGVVDGDDVLASTAMETIVKYYRANPKIGYIYTQHFWCDKTLKKCRSGLSGTPKNISLAESAIKGKHCFSHWRTFRRELASKGTIFPEGLEVSVDKNMGFVLEELAPGAFLPKKLYFYRYYKGNMSLVQGGTQKAMTKRMAKARLKKREEKSIKVYPVVKLK